MIGKLSQSTINGLCSQYIFGINTAILHYCSIEETKVTTSIVLVRTSSSYLRSTLCRNQPRWDFHRGDLRVAIGAIATDLWVAFIRGVGASRPAIQDGTDGIRTRVFFSVSRSSFEASGRHRPNAAPSFPVCQRSSVPTPPSVSLPCAYPLFPFSLP